MRQAQRLDESWINIIESDKTSDKLHCLDVWWNCNDWKSHVESQGLDENIDAIIISIIKIIWSFVSCCLYTDWLKHAQVSIKSGPRREMTRTRICPEGLIESGLCFHEVMFTTLLLCPLSEYKVCGSHDESKDAKMLENYENITWGNDTMFVKHRRGAA